MSAQYQKQEYQYIQSGDHKIPYFQYTMNERQQFACLGVDFKNRPLESEEYTVGDITHSAIGKMKDQNVIFREQIRNSLERDGWDFKAWPDPEILILTNKKNPICIQQPPADLFGFDHE